MISLKDHSAIFAWLGLVAVAVFTIAWICAASLDTAWHFGVNTLSEFGISDTAARYYFNYGCIITGLLVMIFGFGRTAFGKNLGHGVGGALLVSGGIALALVGVFTMDYSTEQMHYIIAMTMAAFFFGAIIAITFGNWFADRKIFAGVGIVVIFCLIPMIFVLDVAAIEGYGIVLALIWLTTESMNMLISDQKNKTKGQV
jgi:hypothetical membrane protein